MKRNKIKCYKLLSKIKDRKIKHKIKKGKNIKYISIVIFILLLFLLYILTDFIIFKKLIKKGKFQIGIYIIQQKYVYVLQQEKKIDI